jgi:hypothetical protein
VVIIGLFEPGVPIFPRGASALRSAEARPGPAPRRPAGGPRRPADHPEPPVPRRC